MTLDAKVRRMNEKLQLAKKKSKDMLGDLDDAVEKAQLILAHFESLDLIDEFATYPDPALHLNLFRLFLYAVVHNQYQSFLAASGMASNYIEVFRKLANMQESNFNFESKFVPENVPLTSNATNSTGRTVIALPIPPIVRKRLGLE